MSGEVQRFTVGADFHPSTRMYCDACRRLFNSGQKVLLTSYPATPWLPEWSEDHEWGSVVWHRDCDRRDQVEP